MRHLARKGIRRRILDQAIGAAEIHHFSRHKTHALTYINSNRNVNALCNTQLMRAFPTNLWGFRMRRVIGFAYSGAFSMDRISQTLDRQTAGYDAAYVCLSGSAAILANLNKNYELHPPSYGGVFHQSKFRLLPRVNCSSIDPQGFSISNN